MFSNLKKKRIYLYILIPIMSFILANVTFFLYFIYQSLIEWIFPNYEDLDKWFPYFKYGVFIMIILLISYIVLKSKIKDLYKAIYCIVPIAVILVTIGKSLYEYMVAEYMVGGFILGGIFLVLYITKRKWYYYYSIVLLTIALVLIELLGFDI